MFVAEFTQLLVSVLL